MKADIKKCFSNILTAIMVIIILITQIGTCFVASAADLVVITYNIGCFKNIDPLAGTITLYSKETLKSKEYAVSDDFDFTIATKHWIEKSDVEVVCKMIGDEVVDFYSQDDICSLSVSSTIKPNSVYAKDGKLNTNQFNLCITTSYLINSQYDFIFDSVLKKLSIRCYALEIQAQSDALNFGASGFWWFKDYKSDTTINMNYDVFAGSPNNQTIAVYVNDNYKLQGVNSVLNVYTTLKYEGGEKTSTSQISVGNLDIEKTERTENKKASKLDNNIKAAKNHLDQNAQSAVVYSGQLDGYISLAQQKYIKEVLFVWIADIFATSSSDYCKQNTQIKDYVYKKLGIDKKYLTDIINTHASFCFVLNTEIGKRTIKFDLELSNFSFGGKPSFAGFGKLNYKMYKQNENEFDCQGTGMVALSDMETFTNQLIKIANEQIKSVFMNTVGNDLDKIATFLTEGTMVQVLKDSGVVKGSFSDNLYNLLVSPTENYLDIEINCPVDIYVYDSSKTLVGKIINDRISESDNKIYTYVNGTEKHLMLFDENYSISIIGNDNGKMDYIVKEISSEGNTIRTISYNNLNVKNGETYYAAVPNAALINASLYNPLDYNNQTVSPSDVSEENIFDYVEPSLVYTSKCGDNVLFDYYSNGFCHIYGNGPMKDYDVKAGTQGVNAPTESPVPNCKQILIDDGVTTIGKNAFRGNSAESIYIGNDVESLGSYSFYNCKALKKISIGAKVRDVFSWAFSYSNSLECIKVDENNPYFKDTEGNLISKDGTRFVKFANSLICSYSIPDGIKTIEEDAFGDVTNLTSVCISDGVKEIKSYAFDGCTKLRNIEFPDSLEIIAGSAFSNTLWYDSQPNGMVYVGKVVYSYKGEKHSLTELNLRSDTVSIASSCFVDCENLKTAVLPSCIKRIGDYAFKNCTSLSQVGFPNGLMYIGNHAFEYCNSLKKIKIPNSVRGMGCYTYNGCKNLIEVELENGLEYIDDYAFLGCDSFSEVAIPITVVNIGENAFDFNQYHRFKIIGIKGSVAEEYANRKGFAFEATDNIQIDPNTGIVISLFDNSIVDVKMVSSPTLSSVITKQIEKERITQLICLSLKNNESTLQLDDIAIVKIPEKNHNSKVYRIEADKTLADMCAYYEEGNLVFITDMVGEFILTQPESNISGDSDGDGIVDSKDRIKLARYLAKWSGYEEIDVSAADVNNDSKVNAKDRIVLARHLAKWQGYESLPFVT